ncbi:MAG: peptidase S1 [Deinococcota bacterium]
MKQVMVSASLVVVLMILSSAFAQGSGGDASLFPGFSPDPYTLSYTAGGSTSASIYGASCRGNIASTPDHVIYLGGFDYLKMAVTSASDTTLVVYSESDGVWFCADDSVGLNPVLSGGWTPGNYFVYVGSFSGNPSYTLSLTEFP